MSSYANADGFGGITTGVKATDPATGIAWTLGFGAPGPDGSPAPAWEVASSWEIAKSRLGTTWGQAKAGLTTWANAKAVVAA